MKIKLLKKLSEKKKEKELDNIFKKYLGKEGDEFTIAITKYLEKYPEEFDNVMRKIEELAVGMDNLIDEIDVFTAELSALNDEILDIADDALDQFLDNVDDNNNNC